MKGGGRGRSEGKPSAPLGPLMSQTFHSWDSGRKVPLAFLVHVDTQYGIRAAGNASHFEMENDDK